MDPIEHGRQALFLGELEQMRVRMGLSKQGLADILGCTYYTVWRWTSHGMLDYPNDRNSEAISTFMVGSTKLLEEYPDFAERFMPLSQAAQKLAVPQEYLFRMYREGKVPGAVDLGWFGAFVDRKVFEHNRKNHPW